MNPKPKRNSANRQQMKEFMDALGFLAEASLLFHRDLIQAGATPEEASYLMQAFIRATMFGSGNTQKSQEEPTE